MFEAGDKIGGQFDIARRIPGKEEFSETIRYYTKLIAKYDIPLHLGIHASADDLAGGHYDEIVLATGVTPRVPTINGIDHPSVLSYVDVVRHDKPVGQKVAVIGAGGIGVDVSEFLTHTESPTLDLEAWQQEWGMTDPETERGGVTDPKPAPSARQVFLVQRKTSRVGKNLGKTTGWVHRAALRAKNVEKITGARYDRIDDQGLHLSFDPKNQQEPRVLDVDTIVVCAGQESARDLADELTARGLAPHVIGGADVAAELDAKRAIKQGTELAAAL